MGISIATLKQAIEGLGLKYQELRPDLIGVGMQMDNTSIQTAITREEDGEYIRLRTIRFFECKEDAPGFAAVLERLAQVNYEYKLIKFGWDESDGEVCAEVAFGLEDNPKFTQDQFGAGYAVLCKVCDEIYPDLVKLRDTRASSARAVVRRSDPPPVRAERREEVTPTRGGNPASTLIAIGVLLLGIAAVLGVVYLIIK